MADMLVKGYDPKNIRFGNTLSDDQLPLERFNYCLANPPFGVDWKKVKKQITDEHKAKGQDGRFGPGLPRSRICDVIDALTRTRRSYASD